MNTFDFDSNVNKSQEMPLVFDGETKGTYLLFPVISFAQRAEMIQQIINSVVADGNYMPYNFNFAFKYFMIVSYTDIAFPDVELEPLEDETEDEFAARKRNAKFSIVFDFITRSTVWQNIQANVKDFDEIVVEVRDGIEFEKQRLATDTSWNRLGNKMQDLFDAVSEAVKDPELLDAVNGLLEAVTTDTSSEAS